MCRIQSGVPPARPPRNKCRCPLQPAESLLARARAPPAARSDSVDVRARRPSPLHPAGPCSATPPALRLLPCAPLDVGRKDRFPLGTRLREDRARVVNAARARSPFPGTPVAVTCFAQKRLLVLVHLFHCKAKKQTPRTATNYSASKSFASLV